MAVHPVGAETARRNPVRVASAPDILNFKLNGTTPFLSHRDAANDRLSDAHAILVIMSRAYLDAQDALSDSSRRETIETIPPGIISEALDAVSNLIAYAQYHIDAVEQEARS